MAGGWRVAAALFLLRCAAGMAPAPNRRRLDSAVAFAVVGLKRAPQYAPYVALGSAPPLLLARRRRTRPAAKRVSAGFDFNGEWKLERSENFDAYLASIGVSASHRGFATKAPVRHRIVQTGTDSFEVCVITRLGTKREAFVVGAAAFTSTDARGDAITKRAIWEKSDRACIVTTVVSSAGTLVDKRRITGAQSMVMELTSPAGKTAYRHFARVQTQ
ncbi:hypothetical protein M885DRAFT_506793 [Pelagophyceae sp. CCMP2097]|nr:hypothetical protein M885DRAFT_506793 [Pelagophyceae sp. CCMP2097]